MTTISFTKPSPKPRDQYGYDAFISYSHAMDRPVAAALQRGLHRLARRWHQIRALRVFRDDTSLSANPHLWSAIEQGLLASRYFILMASPEAARSEWVQREVAHWKRYRTPDTFLIVVTDGQLHWDRDTGDFDWTRTTALPRQLSGWFPDEPLWVPMAGARRDTQLSLRNAEFRAAVCKLAAPLRGMPPDELDSEDIRQHRLAARLRQAAVTALTLLLTIAVVLGVVAAHQRSTALEERDRAIREARIALARGLAAESDAIASRDPLLAARLAVAAYRQEPGPQAITAMMRAVERHRHDIGFVERATQLTDTQDRTFQDAPAGDAIFSPDGRILAVTSRRTGEVRLWDVASQRHIDTFGSEFGPIGEQHNRIRFTDDGSRLAILHPKGVDIWRLADRERIFSRTFPDSVHPFFVSSDGSTIGLAESAQGKIERALLTSTDSPTAALRPIAVGSAASLALQTGYYDDPEAAVAALEARTQEARFTTSENRRAVSLSDNSILQVWDLSNERSIAQRQLPGSTGKWTTIAISGDGRTVLVGDDQGQLVGLDSGLTQTVSLGQLPGAVVRINLSRDGSLAAAVDNGGNVLLLRPTVDQRFDVLPGTAGRIDQEGRPVRQALTASPDGRWLLVHRPGGVELWNLTEKRRIADFATDVEVSQRALEPPTAAFSRDGVRFAVRTHDRVVAREVDSLREVGSVPTNQEPIQVAGAFATALGGVYLVRRDTDGDRAEVVAVSQNESRVIVTGSNIGLIGTRIGDVVAVAAAQSDPSGGDAPYQVSVWRLGAQRAERIGVIDKKNSGVYLLAASQVGQHLLIHGKGPEPEVVDLSNGNRTRLTGGQGRGSYSEYVFLAAGRLLVQHVVPDRDSYEARNRLLLWYPDTGTLLGEWSEPTRLEYPGQQPDYLVAAGDKAVLTIRADGSIAVWRFSPDDWANHLCNLAGDLDPTQQQRYLPKSFQRPVC